MLDDCCLILIIMLLPPVGVFLMKGCGAEFWINLCLTIFGYIPGHLHGFYVMVKERERAQYIAQHYSTPNPPAAYYGTLPSRQVHSYPPPVSSEPTIPYQPGPLASESSPVSHETIPPRYEPPSYTIAQSSEKK